ncbi:MAG: hypothetical protein AB7F76_13875 [Parvibaculaceae bacterium]
MENITIMEFARQLVVIHGAKACEEAAMQERICEKFGAERTARTWRHVRTALNDIRACRVN